MTKQEIEKIILDIKALDKYSKEIEQEIETKKDIIKEYMDKEQIETLNTDSFRIDWKVVISNRFDSTAFKKDCPELAKKYTKATESKPFKIY